MGGLSIWHWLIVLLVVVLIFGTKKLRNIGQDLGGAVKGFKEGVKGRDRGRGRCREAGSAQQIAGTTIDAEVEGEDAVARAQQASARAGARCACAADAPRPPRCSTSAFPRSSSSPSWR